MLIRHRSLLGVLVLAVAACHSSSADAKGKKDDQTPVAKVGGETITAADLDKLVGAQLQQMERDHDKQVYDTRRQALEKLVQDKIFAAEAKKANLTVEQYMQKVQQDLLAKVAEPAPEQVKSLYDQAVASGRKLPPFDQIRPDIVNFIKSQQAGPQAQAFFESLKKDSGVEILMPAYRPAPVDVEAKGPSKGPSKAPITIVEFSDFQCPYCVKAEPELAAVMAAYPDKIKLVYRDFPLDFHPLAQKASEAAYCAEDQGKYWEMHERLFKANGKDLAVDNLKAYAKELSLDAAKFDKCLDSGDKAKVVAEHKKAGEAAGVNGTPAFFVNGRPYSGVIPADQFKQIIDDELKALGIVAKK